MFITSLKSPRPRLFISFLSNREYNTETLVKVTTKALSYVCTQINTQMCFFFCSSFQTHPLLVWMTVTVSRDTVILEEMVGLPQGGGFWLICAHTSAVNDVILCRYISTQVSWRGCVRTILQLSRPVKWSHGALLKLTPSCLSKNNCNIIALIVYSRYGLTCCFCPTDMRCWLQQRTSLCWSKTA